MVLMVLLVHLVIVHSVLFHTLNKISEYSEDSCSLILIQIIKNILTELFLIFLNIQTITGGARRRNAALMLTMNEQERKRQEKFLSGIPSCFF